MFVSCPADPVFRYSGGYDTSVTPYKCLKQCMAQELHQVSYKYYWIIDNSGFTILFLYILGHKWGGEVSVHPKKATYLNEGELNTTLLFFVIVSYNLVPLAKTLCCV